MGLVAGLIGVLLVEEEQVRVLFGALGLVEDAARLGPRRGSHLLDHLEQAVSLTGVRAPLGGHDVSHVTFPFVRWCYATRRCPRPRARRRPLAGASGRALGPTRRPPCPIRSPRRGTASGSERRRRSCRRSCGASPRWSSHPTPRRSPARPSARPRR